MDFVVSFQGTIYQEGYGQLPRKVMRDKELHKTARLIYAYICSFASNSNSGEKTAFPSVALQCDELGLSEDTYYIHRKSLIQKGYLKIEKRRGESGKFDRNLYTICAVPEPLPDKPKDLEEAIPEKLGYGENVDLEPFSPHPKNSGMDEPYPNYPSTVGPSTDNSGTKTTNTKTTNTKKNISLVSSSRESAQSLYELIDKTLKQEFPDVPFEELKDELINDETAVINTAKQYHAMLKYRLQTHKPRKQAKRPQFKAKQPIRKEQLPNWFDEENEPNTGVKQANEISDEEKAELEEILKSMRNK